MKAKKLMALLLCVITALVLFSVMSFAEGEAVNTECTHPELRCETTLQTCEKEGEDKWYCVYCGELIKTESIPMHNFVVVYTDKQATCTQPGVETVYCTWCNKLDKVSIDPDLSNHSFSAWEVKIPATCNKEGEEERRCSRCNKVEKRPVPVDSTKHIAKEGSAWTIVIKPTCHTDGTQKNICRVCEQEFTVILPSHYDYADTEKYTLVSAEEGNCAVASSATYKCKKYLCIFTVTGEKIPDAHNFSVESRWEYKPGESGETPSCKNPGIVVKHCANLYAHTVTEVYAPHDFSGEEEIITPAGCSNDGLKKVKCLYCDETENVTIPAGHFMGDWEFVSGDCAQGGVASRSCPCGALKEENVPFAAGTHLNFDVLANDPADCESIGWQIVKCKDCGTVFEYFPEGNDPVGHDAKVWTEIKKATCTEAGEEQRVCLTCGKVVETRPIPQLSHGFVILKKGTPATCTEAGITDYRYCIYCSATFEQETLPALGHNFVEQSSPDEVGTLICDRCYQYKVGEDNITTCNCLCHNSNGLAKTVFKFVNFIYKLFGIKALCNCGIAHYDASTSIFQDIFSK